MDNLQEYRRTQEYKMVFILSGFRILAGLTGIKFLKDLKDYRNHFLNEEFHSDKNTISSIEYGIIQLNAREVELYAYYISESYKYDSEYFYDVVMEEAKRLPKEINYNSSHIILINAIARIVKMMQEVS